jgi:cold-inducible RNA-binding protein
VRVDVGSKKLKKIYVGNLSYQTTEQDLETMFAEHGAVKSVSIIRDRQTGTSRGFGFIEMESDEAASAAIAALNGTQLDDRTLTVNEARPRAERRDRPRGRGGDRGGRRW